MWSSLTRLPHFQPHVHPTADSFTDRYCEENKLTFNPSWRFPFQFGILEHFRLT